MLCKQKLLFWMRLISINHLTALIYISNQFYICNCVFACSRLTVSLCFIAVTFAGYITRLILCLSMLFYTILILYYFASNGTNSNYTLFVGSAEYIKTEPYYITFASSFSVVLKYFLMIIIKLMWCEKIISETSHMQLSLFHPWSASTCQGEGGRENQLIQRHCLENLWIRVSKPSAIL